MNDMRSSRTLTMAVAVVIASALLGGLFGGRVLAGQDRLSQHYEAFTTALAAIETTYVGGEVDSEWLVYGAIGGLLQTLDPHSSFMDPRSYAQLRQRQEGRYYGVGMTINVFDDAVTVQGLFEGSPAYRAGIRRGDVIARIAGQDAPRTSDEAVALLKGPRGSTVLVSIRRQGYDELIDLEVERDEITIPTVQGAFMIDETIGYVRLSAFSAPTSGELRAALRELDESGMKELLLDLRDNPGGQLDQAIRVSNEFLPRGDLIVYTRGRVQNSDQDYHAREEGDHNDIPLVVLVNRNSASASEIVSGAIQDHDRGLIVGETTFGKALVQSGYEVSHGAGLFLTTARYYTPSGRLIQRAWDATFDEYRFSTRDLQPADHPASERQLTDGGREVFGGGGIEPDYLMAGPIEGFDPTRLGRRLVARQEFAEFAERFSAEGDTRIKAAGRGRQRVSRGFVIDDAMMADFRSHLESRRLTFNEAAEAAFASDETFIRAMMHYEIDIALFGRDEARRNLTASDPQAQYAVTLFPEAARLFNMSRQIDTPAP